MLDPMKAQSYDPNHVSSLRYAQPKLDGMRLLWTGREVLSKNNKLINSVPGIITELHDKFKDIPLDGELYSPGRSFQSILAVTRRTVNIQDDPSIKFHVFDSPMKNVIYKNRKDYLESNFLKLGFKKSDDQLIKDDSRILTVPVRDVSQVKNDFESLNIFGELGYQGSSCEGTMLYSGIGIYQFGKRCFDIMKLKVFHDLECKVVSLNEGKRKYKGFMGALVCKTLYNSVGIAPGLIILVGTGFDDNQRKVWWLNPQEIIGKIITIKFQDKTEDGIPKFSSFKAIRSELSETINS